MKVRDAITIRLQTASNFRDGTRIRDDIEQHRSRVADQPPSPNGDDGRANDANKRIDPGPAKRPSQTKADDRENRGCAIRQNVAVGATKVAVGMAVRRIASIVVAMIVRAVMVVVIVAQQPRAYEIDDESNDREGNAFAVRDRDSLRQPKQALVPNQQSDHRQYNCARVPGKLT